MARKIEKVQKRALRLIPSLSGLNYQTKLKMTGLLSLSNRRKMFDLVEMYKRTKKGVVRYQTNYKNTRNAENRLLEVPKFRLDFFLFEMVRDRRVLCRVQLTRPPLTELNQCAFTSDSYLFYSAPDI